MTMSTEQKVISAVESVIEKATQKPAAPPPPAPPAVPPDPPYDPKIDAAVWNRWWVWAGIAALVIGFGLAIWVNRGLAAPASEPKLATGLNPFALLFVMALAIERVIQPVAPFLGPNTSKRRKNLHATKVTLPGDNQAIADAEAAVSDARNQTAFVTWGAASGLAIILAAALHITLLRTVISGSGFPPFWLDLLLTGLIVGAGTKPLNDLWTRLQNKP
ncbi:MAG TPA: hypothetical protein VH352_19135 [Pseudonocardiaceae bacterium]|nr:hypothetical protein [Pseudonocardiaceae bacterium]